MGTTSDDRSAERSHLPVASPPTNHGHTTAAWVTVVLILVGGAISSVAVIAARPVFFWVGLAVVLVGVVAGKALKMLGFGQPGLDRGSDAEASARS